jgi:AcrR family transcriptional regulator
MQATGRAIGSHGLAGLTLAAVAGQAGLSPATLVQRFGSKRALLLAFAAQAADAVRGPFRRARQAHTSPLVALHTALAELVSAVRTPTELANNLGFVQLDLTDPAFRQHAGEHLGRMHAEIADLLADAVAAGELAGNVEPARLARSVQVAYNGVLLVWAITAQGPLADALHAEIDQLLRPYRPRDQQGM